MIAILERRNSMSDPSSPGHRHPERRKFPLTPITRKPAWLRVKAPQGAKLLETDAILARAGVVTVCQEAACPNRTECWSSRHASFLIMGDICTRACAFCNVRTGKPKPLDITEPDRVARAVRDLELRHVVVTSVDRDDLPDGGANHFSEVVRAIRQLCSSTSIEILTPDFQRKASALDILSSAPPDVFNHNIETVPSLYPTVRPGARYFGSLRLLQSVKERCDNLFTKSGFMVGLGERPIEVMQLMDDLRSADVDFLTIGQYLQPTRRHAVVDRFVPPEEFNELATIARSKGFLQVSASPLTRSSYHADEDFLALKKARSRQTHDPSNVI